MTTDTGMGELVQRLRHEAHLIRAERNGWKELTPRSKTLDEAADAISTLTARVEALEAERTNLIATKREQIERLAEEQREAILSATKVEREACADAARCAFDDRPRRDGMDWNDGFDDGTKAAATAIRQRSEKQ